MARSVGQHPGRGEVLLSLRQMNAAPTAELERLAAYDALDWALLDSYLRIGCTVREALLAVVGDVLLRAQQPGAGADDVAAAHSHLDHFGLTADEVLGALGLAAS